ncbi:MAG: DUF1836 domain-containing protein [Lachnospiraceae bacterium]|nr:DUF1836 domain-containing protein [Lachnospiraceae bacterium]MBR4794915.1 DUF1836 domain-containing protein [Lachnospiraceae bacterium]MBR5789272.1 DUF1836 domain-containing protein [Lachnospiraceae bacterium]
MDFNPISLEQLIEVLNENDFIDISEFPNIDLYMDQLTTFMDKYLASGKRSDDDKILTKTMINNYAKNGLLPSPEKKQYSKAHLISLTFIYYLKNILSINDIKKIMDPLHSRYFNAEGFNMEDIYKEVFTPEPDGMKIMKKDIERQYNLSKTLFADVPDKDKEFLQTFAFLCELSYGIYIRKHLLEKIMDTFPSPEERIRLEKEAKKQEKKALEEKKKSEEAKKKEQVKKDKK